ncbi:MAG: hypothetical protein II802_00990 [Clostridia bacterium]|nr:hypothetical protein [Clostridia bacterium]
MENFLGHIRDESDLELYKKYLEQNDATKSEESAEQIMPPPETEKQYVPETLSNSAFLPAYLKRNIGKIMKIEFLIGGKMETRIGKLIAVGASFIELKRLKQAGTMICDMNSIKFVTVIHDNDLRKLNYR